MYWKTNQAKLIELSFLWIGFWVPQPWSRNSGGSRDTPANVLCQNPKSPTKLNLTAKPPHTHTTPRKLDGGMDLPKTKKIKNAMMGGSEKMSSEIFTVSTHKGHTTIFRNSPFSLFCPGAENGFCKNDFRRQGFRKMNSEKWIRQKMDFEERDSEKNGFRKKWIAKTGVPKRMDSEKWIQKPSHPIVPGVFPRTNCS